MAVVYVGRISDRTGHHDLERVFSKYGRIRDVRLRRDFGFIEFDNPRDAEDAAYYLHGYELDGSRLIVERARSQRDDRRDNGRDYRGGGGYGYDRGGYGNRRDGGQGGGGTVGRCYNCGKDGHWARDCTAGDWSNRCYRCGSKGHIQRDCTASRSRSKSRSRSRGRRSHSRSRSRSPRSHSRSRSRSPRSRSRSPRSRSRSPHSCSRSISRSASRSRSHSHSKSPIRRSASPEQNKVSDDIEDDDLSKNTDTNVSLEEEKEDTET